MAVAHPVLSFLWWCNSRSNLEGITTKKSNRATLSSTCPRISSPVLAPLYREGSELD